jgi:cobalt-zinc-cadmium efflux system protein
MDHFAPNQQSKSWKAATRLGIAFSVTLAFIAVEVLAGLASHSLALLSDAAHNTTDLIAIILTWWALRLTLRTSNARNTFGFHRAGILVAVLNSATLVLIALGIFYEAYQRLMTPPSVKSGIVVVVGLIALVVNAGTALLLRPGSEYDLNLRSAFLHLMGDAVSSLGTVVAGVIILFTGWNWLDPAVSILIGLLILWSAWGILREAVDILLEATPRDINLSVVVRDMMGVPGVLGVHDLHVWSLSRGLRTMSAHIVTDDIPISAAAQIQMGINDVLVHEHNIAHATLQLECVSCSPEKLFCDIGLSGRAQSSKSITHMLYTFLSMKASRNLI